MDIQLIAGNISFATYADKINEMLSEQIGHTYDELDIADAQVHYDFKEGVPAEDIVKTLVSRFEQEQEDDDHHNHLFN